MNHNSFVELIDVHKSYGKTLVLDGISLSVSKGEFIVLLGPSGEGKTTLLNIIAGVVRPNKGKVFIDGTLIDDSDTVYIPPERRDIGYVFQNYALYPHMTAFDNIAFPLKMKKLSKDEIEERVIKVAKMLKIDHVLRNKPSQLSGGQQQRVAVARAIVKEPKLLLMDEPFSNIDPALRVNVRWELRVLFKNLGITTIMATHDQEEAMVIADRIMVLRGGRALQIDTPKKIYEEPVNKFVAEFVGGMNILNADSNVLSIIEEIYASSLKDVRPKYIGFRLEDVLINERGFEAKIIDKEYKGDRWVIISELASGDVIKFYSKDLNVGSTLYVRPTKVYLFSDDGKVIDIIK